VILAVRGAIGVAENSQGAIHAAGRRLVRELLAANRIAERKILHIVFTLTPDLDAGNPATGLRELGFGRTPLLCVQEAAVRGAAARIIRVLVTWRAPWPALRRRAPRPVYLDGAEALRPDLGSGPAGGRAP
jgi:chorismate mutase